MYTRVGQNTIIYMLQLICKLSINGFCCFDEIPSFNKGTNIMLTIKFIYCYISIQNILQYYYYKYLFIFTFETRYRRFVRVATSDYG